MFTSYPFPKPPAQNSKVYENKKALEFLCYGLRESAKRMGFKNMNSLTRRIKSNIIEHILVNERPFIPDYVIEKYLNKDYKRKVVRITDTTSKIPITKDLSRFEDLVFFLELLGGDSQCKITLNYISVEKWDNKEPIKIIHDEKFIIKATPNKCMQDFFYEVIFYTPDNMWECSLQKYEWDCFFDMYKDKNEKFYKKFEVYKREGLSKIIRI